LETHRITQNLDPEEGRRANQQLPAGVTLLDRYLIQGVIGVGGMGAVYRARDLHFPNVTKHVAVKEMFIQTADPMVRKTIVRNFEREANILATLDHRAIPRIYDYFTLNERSYLVLEYVNGKDLEALINDSETFLDPERVAGWGMELCEVLEYLHNHLPEPIIFRDMKPSNVMINAHGHIVLVDFGIAKPFMVGQRGTMIGTEGYSPPEQYRGEATPAADIYALGATLHHALTRRDPRLEPPFSFSERPIPTINPKVPPELAEVIRRALQYEMEERYPSAAAMKDALMQAAQQTGMLTSSVTPVRRGGGDAIRPIWAFTCEDEIRGAPAVANGSVFVGAYDNNLYALNAASGEFQWKYPTDGGIVSRPLVYENNVYFGSEDHRLHVLTAHSGRVNWTYFAEGPIRSSPLVAAGHVFIGSDDGYLHAVNTFTGRPAWRMDAAAPVRSSPVVHLENVFFGNENGDFFCIDFRGAVKWRFKAKRAISSSPVIAQNIILFSSVDATLYALDAKTGWVVWRARLGKPSISSPCLADQSVFVGAIDGVLSCFDISSAKEMWRFSAENQITGSATIYKDSLYFGSVDGWVYCLEYRTGRLRWKFKTQGPITGTPVAADDIIYIGSTDHKLYALMA
jgi:serine/threonine protein kinase